MWVCILPMQKFILSAGTRPTDSDFGKTSSFEEIRKISGYEDSIFRLALSADGKVLASRDLNGKQFGSGTQ